MEWQLSVVSALLESLAGLTNALIFPWWAATCDLWIWECFAMQWGAAAFPHQIQSAGQENKRDFFNLMIETFQAFFSPHLFLMLYGFNCMCSEEAKTFPALEELLSSQFSSSLSLWLSSNTAKWHVPSLADAISALIKLYANPHGGSSLLFLFASHCTFP